MKTIAFILCAGALLTPAYAQSPGQAENPGVPLSGLRNLTQSIRERSTSSWSGQFIIYTASLLRPSRELASNPNLIALDPRLLAISCERIKLSFNRALGAPPGWRGKIYLQLTPARSADDSITLVADKQPGGWAYQLSLPNVLERERFVRTIVDVLLLEMANRGAGSRSSEIPTWLAEGLAQEILATDGVEFMLPPPDVIENGITVSRLDVHLTDSPAWLSPNTRPLNPLTEAQKVLRVRSPLTLDQLSWPTAEQLTGPAGEVYRSSAQLFVDQLLHLKNGPACFCAMLNDLPNRLNWQFAFLNGFRPHFQNLLDVEKWWALQLVHFTGRDLMQAWTPEESWKKLDEIVRSPVEVRSQRGELPLHTEVSLQKIIREWDLVRQTQMLERKLQELNLLRIRVAQDLVMLVDDYRGVLGNYLQRRGTSGRLLPLGQAAGPISDRLTQETIKQLDALDTRRLALRPGQSTPPAPPQPALTGVR
jgi:hypothetical protein